MRKNKELVVDACLIFDSIAGDDVRFDIANRFVEECSRSRIKLIAPPAFSGEIDTAARQSLHRRRVLEDELPIIYNAIDAIPVVVILDETILQIIRLRAREIAVMLGQPSVYDSTYAALAELRECDFWTADKRFANAASQQRRQPDGTSASPFPFVKFIEEYQ